MLCVLRAGVPSLLLHPIGLHASLCDGVGEGGIGLGKEGIQGIEGFFLGERLGSGWRIGCLVWCWFYGKVYSVDTNL